MAWAPAEEKKLDEKVAARRIWKNVPQSDKTAKGKE